MVRIIASLIGAAALFSQVAAAPVIARDGHLAATTTAAAAYETPAPVHESAAVEPTTLHVAPPSHETTTQHAAAPTYTPPAQYGSGHANWGNSYEDCVQQCIAQHGAPPAGTYTAPADPTPTGTPTEGGAGNGATHTVIVAPSQGVLRFVPFALNASVGDTVLFKWGGGPHTVSKSSTLNLCNRTLEDDFFTSGRQNASFQFTQVINDTNPVFYYCSVGEHCARGMFGVLNPPSALGSPDSVGAKMKEWTDANPNLKAAYDQIMAKANGGPAANWGNSISVAGIPEEAHAALAENVLYNRAFFAENPGAIEYGHGAALPDGNELTIPADLSLLLSGTAGNPAGANGAQAGTPPAENTPTSTPTPSGLASTNGAGSLASSGLAVAFVAVVATFFAL